MPQVFPAGQSENSANPESTPPDEVMREQMQKALHEAADRVTFLRCELERWERLGRAANDAMIQLSAAAPVEQQSPDGFGLKDEQSASY